MGLPITVRANGKVFTRNSVAVRPGGLARFRDLDSINWSDERAIELIQAFNDGGAPIGKAIGPYTCDASISVYVDACSAWEAMVVLADPLSLGQLANANFPLVLAIREDIRVRTILLVDCSIKKRGVTVGNDGAALVQEYGLQPRMILEDGQALVNLVPSL